MSMRDAVSRFVQDGDTVVIEGFTHLICFAAGHEIIRQRRRDLTLARLTPDLIYDQMIAAGCARKLVFSWAGNPGVGSLHACRRALEGKSAGGLELEEYSDFGMVGRISAGAAFTCGSVCCDRDKFLSLRSESIAGEPHKRAPSLAVSVYGVRDRSGYLA